MSLSAPFVIHLLRNNAAADDVIKISPSLDLFKITYSDRSSGHSSFFYTDAAECIRYVEDLFYLLEDDADPFAKIQFTFPCFPAVIYNVPEFNTTVIRRTIRERLAATLHNWPEKMLV
jgi:hypothetical protein